MYRQLEAGREASLSAGWQSWQGGLPERRVGCQWRKLVAARDNNPAYNSSCGAGLRPGRGSIGGYAADQPGGSWHW
jgi:hypothetical protein